MVIRASRVAMFEAKTAANNREAISNASDKAIAARSNFEIFRQYVCGHESPPHHQGWISVLNTGIDSECLYGIGGPDTLILSPRNSAKSSFLVEWIAYQLGIHLAPEVRIPLKIMYVSYSVDVALLKSEQIQAIIEEGRYQEVFPWVRKGSKWGTSLWDIDKNLAGLTLTGEPYTLACAGLKGTVVSKRANLVCLDDLIKSPDQIFNPSIREKMASNWSNAIRPTMYEGARAICLGTRMGGDDIYATTFTEERNWHVIEEAAIVENEDGEEESYWPSQASLGFLQGLRDDDPAAFELQYQNNIPKDEFGIVAPEWWIEDIVPPVDEMDSLVVGTDFSASKKEQSDYTVFILMGKKDDIYYLVDIRRGKWTGNLDKCNVLLGLLLDHGIIETDTPYFVDRSGKLTWDLDSELGLPKVYPTGLYVNIYAEGQSYQISFKSDYQSYIQNDLNIFNLSVLTVIPKGDKLQRLRGITGILQKKKVIINKYCPGFKVLKKELLNFGFVRRDDTVDAAVYGLTGMAGRPNLDSAR
jgi:phage terminase large subunit-like protein